MRRKLLPTATLVLFAAAALHPGVSAAAPDRLSYSKARNAIQAKADRFAQTSTRITAMFRLGDLIWSGRAEWKRENPHGCVGCGYDPVTGGSYDVPTTETCSIGLRAKQLSSGRVRVSTEDFACY